MKLKQFICEYCEEKFERRNGKRVYRFCSIRCAQKVIAPGNRSIDAYRKRLLKKYDENTVELFIAENKRKRSVATSEKNRGKILSAETRKKISESCTGIPNVVKGKTYKEFYGADKAKELSEYHSEKLKEGYATGKIKMSKPTKDLPVYKGVKLRSKLELAAIQYLEAEHELIFDVDLIYEDPRVKVQWLDCEDKYHTYHPDLHDTKNNIVYEVKPQYKLAKNDDVIARKMDAIIAAGRDCRYLTDIDVKKYYSLLCKKGAWNNK